MKLIKTNECLYHIKAMNMSNVISKRIEANSKDVIMDKTHMKEKHVTKSDKLVYKKENLTDSSTEVKTILEKHQGL